MRIFVRISSTHRENVSDTIILYNSPEGGRREIHTIQEIRYKSILWIQVPYRENREHRFWEIAIRDKQTHNARFQSSDSVLVRPKHEEPMINIAINISIRFSCLVCIEMTAWVTHSHCQTRRRVNWKLSSPSGNHIWNPREWGRNIECSINLLIWFSVVFRCIQTNARTDLIESKIIKLRYFPLRNASIYLVTAACKLLLLLP